MKLKGTWELKPESDRSDKEIYECLLNDDVRVGVSQVTGEQWEWIRPFFPFAEYEKALLLVVCQGIELAASSSREFSSVPLRSTSLKLF